MDTTSQAGVSHHQIPGRKCGDNTKDYCCSKFNDNYSQNTFFIVLQALSFAALVSAGVSVSETCSGSSTCRVTVASGSTGWLAFVAFVVLIYELLAIAARFINFDFITKFQRVIFHAVRS